MSVTAVPDEAEIDSWISPRGLWCLRQWPWDITWSCNTAAIRSRTATHGIPPSPDSFWGGLQHPRVLGCPSCHNTAVPTWIPWRGKVTHFPHFMPLCSQPPPDTLPSPLRTRQTWIHTTSNGAQPPNSRTQVPKERPKIGQHGNTSVLCFGAWTRPGLGPSFPIPLFRSCPSLRRGSRHAFRVPQGMHLPSHTHFHPWVPGGIKLPHVLFGGTTPLACSLFPCFDFYVNHCNLLEYY